jgi:hypothetical protein
MSEKGGAAAVVSALTAKAKLAGMWREKVDQHNPGNPVYERIERVIVERARRRRLAVSPTKASIVIKDMTPGKIARVIQRLEKVQELERTVANDSVREELQRIAIERDLEAQERKLLEDWFE